jgi:hypothetical protein
VEYTGGRDRKYNKVRYFLKLEAIFEFKIYKSPEKNNDNFL